MSFQKLSVNQIFHKVVKGRGLLSFKAYYSRRSDSKSTNINFKIVKSSNIVHDGVSPELSIDANWELLAPRGYRFFMPGGVGTAWQSVSSMWSPNHALNKLINFPDKTSGILDLATYECPVLLRKSLLELFPHSDVETCTNLTVVTLSNNKATKLESDSDVEKISMTFVLAAQEICARLTLAGYWADFINPFSGRPHNSPFHNSKLYDTDERFRCVGFSIEDKSPCTVILGDSNLGRGFKGNIFTDAPSKTEALAELLGI